MKPVPCRWWRESHLRRAGWCTLGKYGGHPTRAVCGICLEAGKARPAGLGDLVAIVATRVKRLLFRTRVGRRKLSRCGCDARRRAWNKAVPLTVRGRR